MELLIGMVTSVPGKIRNLKLAPHNGLIPVIEAIMNSIQAIRELQKKDKNYEGEIEIEIVRQIEGITDEKINTQIESVKITDNGIGFTTANRNSFHEAEST